MCGGKYFNFNTNIVRTVFIDPTKEQKKNYLIVTELMDHILHQLKPGNLLNSVYQAAITFLNEKAHHLVEKIGQYIGFGVYIIIFK